MLWSLVSFIYTSADMFWINKQPWVLTWRCACPARPSSCPRRRSQSTSACSAAARTSGASSFGGTAWTSRLPSCAASPASEPPAWPGTTGRSRPSERTSAASTCSSGRLQRKEREINSRWKVKRRKYKLRLKLFIFFWCFTALNGKLEVVSVTFDVEEAVEVRQRDAAVDGVPPIWQLVISVEPVEVVFTVLKLEPQQKWDTLTLLNVTWWELQTQEQKAVDVVFLGVQCVCLRHLRQIAFTVSYRGEWRLHFLVVRFFSLIKMFSSKFHTIFHLV